MTDSTALHIFHELSYKLSYKISVIYPLTNGKISVFNDDQTHK